MGEASWCCLRIRRRRVDRLLARVIALSRSKPKASRVHRPAWARLDICRRPPRFSDTSTIGAVGYPGPELLGRVVMAVPAGTPPAIVDKLNAATVNKSEPRME